MNWEKLLLTRKYLNNGIYNINIWRNKPIQRLYHPEDNRMFIFSPYYIEVTGTAAQQQIKITINGENFVRFTNAAYKAKFPISGVLKSVFCRC